MNTIDILVRLIIALLIVLFIVLFIVRIITISKLKKIKKSKVYDVYISQVNEKTEENSSITLDYKFLYIPVSRLVIMSIVTLGLYEAYWIYKNWKYLKERYKLKIHPFWRGIFGVFFCHSLLNSIKKDSEVNAIRKAEFSASVLATGWIILIVLGNLLGRVDDITVNILGLIIAIPSFLFFLPVQNYINTVNDSIEPRPKYNKWSGGHFVCLIIGIIFWVLIIYGISAM